MIDRNKFDAFLIYHGGDPELFWQNAEAAARGYRGEAHILNKDAPADVIDDAFTWSDSAQGDAYWRRIHVKMERDEDSFADFVFVNPSQEIYAQPTIISCCAWNGHPIYCKCEKEIRNG